jgi:hypothetical protein
VALDDDRRGALLAAKLKGLVRKRTPGVELAAQPFAQGAAVVAGDEGWFLAEREPVRVLGPALAWARNAGVAHLHVVVDDAAGAVARRAAAFRQPPTVWRADGAELIEAVPAPLDAPPPPPDDIETLVALLVAAGVDVVVEHGEVTGEVAGLEVARVVVDGETPRLAVGVGRHDREAFALMHGDVPTAQALATVVEAVREQRRPESPAHPLNRLGADRWMRDALLADPNRIGLSALAPRPLTFPRSSLKEQYPAAAVGVDADGTRIVVVTSVGVDLDLVPTAADVRLAVDADDEVVSPLWLVLPERDALPVTRDLAAALVHPAVVVPLAGDWRRAPA